MGGERWNVNFLCVGGGRKQSHRCGTTKILSTHGNPDHAQPPPKQSFVNRSLIKGVDPTMQAIPTGINKLTNQRTVDESPSEWTDGHMH